jgi:DNA processing protein
MSGMPIPAGPDLEADRVARVALGTLGEPGDPRISSLVRQLGAGWVRDLLLAERDPGDGLLDDVRARLGGNDAERDLARAARLGIRFVIPGDDEWPRRADDLAVPATLRERGGPPLGLWVRGPLRLDGLERSIAVVGSRSSTGHGNAAAGEISAVTARAGFTVISGAAYGIDQAAHRGALAAGGRTVAVLACGVDRAYPTAHGPLLDHLAEHGAVVSELAPGRAPTRIRFLTRNRVIAALTAGTVVVEAALRSGALSTAGWAIRLQRPLMGVPGPVTEAQSEGVHQLIRSGAAVLVTNGAEVLEVVGRSGEHLLLPGRAATTRRDRLSERDARVLEALPHTRPAPVPSIAATAGIGLIDVAAALGRLERAGLAEQGGQGWRITSVNAADSAANGAEIPTMDP